MKLTLIFSFVIGGALFFSGCATTPPLINAAAKGDVSEIELLLAKGTPIDAKGSDYGYTALMAAVQHGQLEAVRFLLSKGANARIATEAWRNNALHFAVNGEIRPGMTPEMISLLLNAGANPLGKDLNGKTPYDAVQGSIHDGLPGIDEIRKMFHAEIARRTSHDPDVTAAAPQAVLYAVPVSLPVPIRPASAFELKPKFSLAERPEDYAVVVGVENYEDLPAASYAERDARAARAFIHALGVPERNIMSLTGTRATRTGLEKAFEAWLPNNVSEESRVFIFYSGHGAPDTKTKEAYLVPSDGDPQYLAQTGYPLKRLYEKLGALKAKQVLVALDSCFSGAGGRSVLAKGTRPLVGKVNMSADGNPKLAVVSASGGDQISGSKDDAEYGMFTYNLLSGLNGAAKNGRGEVTLQSLYDYVKPKVQDEARRANREQTPQLQCASPNELILRAK